MIVLFFILCIVLGLAITPFVLFAVHRINKKRIARLTEIRDLFMFSTVDKKEIPNKVELYKEVGTLYAQIIRIADPRTREVAKAIVDDVRALVSENKAYASNN